MNRSRRDPFRMGIATVISVLMLTLSVAVPVLEKGALFSHPVAEAEHNPGECPAGHDHTVCTQVGANFAFEGRSLDNPGHSDGVTSSAPSADDTTTAPAWASNKRSRAPPLA